MNLITDDRKSKVEMLARFVESKVLSSTRDAPRLEVVFMADSFLPHAGGSRVYYFNLYKLAAEQLNCRVTVLTKKVPGWREFDSRVSNDAFQIIRHSKPLPNWKYYQIPKILSVLCRTLRLVKSRPGAVLHVGDLFPHGLIALWIKKCLGVPYIVYSHGEEITQIDHRRYQPALRNAIYRTADAVVAANGFAKTNLLRIGVAESRIVIINPGVNTRQYCPGPQNSGLARDLKTLGKVTILTVGRLVPRKGHVQVLQALARIRAQVPPFHYLIVGEGAEARNILDTVSRLGLSDHVSLLGKIPEGQLAEVYRLCDLFVLANREIRGDLEGFGMVFLEANACGKPVLGGRSGGATEAVIDGVTGILADAENIDELASSIQLLLTSAGLRSRLGEAGLRRAQRDFSWKQKAVALAEVSRQVQSTASGQCRLFKGTKGAVPC